MEKNSKIAVLGSSGLVGSAIIRNLKQNSYTNIIEVNRSVCNLLDTIAVDIFLKKNRPDYVINCAGKVGGINANNTKSAEFINENLKIQINVINACHKYNVKKLMMLGSSCIYPRNCPQPIKEEYLLTSSLEETNIGYAIAKIAGIIMGRMYNKQYGDNIISVMPTNLYGINDSFHLTDSHVLPALIRKMHDAKVRGDESVEFWGSGTPRREFLYVDDLAEAVVFLMNNYNDCKQHINIGCGEDITIRDLVDLVRKVVGYDGNVVWNMAYPDGTPVKRLDVSKINALGWKAKTSLEDGLKITYKWFVENYNNARK